MHVAFVRAETREGLIAELEDVMDQLKRGTRFLEGEHVLRATGYIHSDWPRRPDDPSQQRLAEQLTAAAEHFGRTK